MSKKILRIITNHCEVIIYEILLLKKYFGKGSLGLFKEYFSNDKQPINCGYFTKVDFSKNTFHTISITAKVEFLKNVFSKG